LVLLYPLTRRRLLTASIGLDQLALIGHVRIAKITDVVENSLDVNKILLDVDHIISDNLKL
jgi:hypothetical protein